MPRATDPATRRRWQQRLRRFARSGLSVAAFCSREGVSPATFYAWQRRLRAEAPSPGAAPPRFLPVCLASPPPPAPAELLLPSGCIPRLSPECDPAWVRQLLELLGVRPC
jgi:transposase